MCVDVPVYSAIFSFAIAAYVTRHFEADTCDDNVIIVGTRPVSTMDCRAGTDLSHFWC